MAFLTLTDIADRLPSTSDIHEVEDLLLRVERDLKTLNLFFDETVEKTKNIGDDHFCISHFDLGFVTAITDVAIKRRDSTELEQLDATEYELTPHDTINNYYTALRLFCPLNEYYRLVITGKFGLYINFSDDTSYPAKLLKSIIIKFIKKQLSYSQANFQTIVESTTGDSRTKVNVSQFREYYPNLTDDPEFRSDLNYFRV